MSRGPDSDAVFVERYISSEYYRDKGCEFAPSCLSCPFAVCVYENWQERRRLRTLARAQAALAQCSSLAEARHEGISKRTYGRMKARVRQMEAALMRVSTTPAPASAAAHGGGSASPGS